MATQSASKPPNVIPIPQNPTLRVPPGFVVNVFADNLDAPRWLVITAKGDVLVTETRQNRIRLLRDTNGDGIADGSKTFAGYHLRIIISSWLTLPDLKVRGFLVHREILPRVVAKSQTEDLISPSVNSRVSLGIC